MHRIYFTGVTEIVTVGLRLITDGFCDNEKPNEPDAKKFSSTRSAHLLREPRLPDFFFL